MKNYKDLNIGKVVYISAFYHVPDSWRYLLKGFEFIFNGVTRARENHQKGGEI